MTDFNLSEHLEILESSLSHCDPNLHSAPVANHSISSLTKVTRAV